MPEYKWPPMSKRKIMGQRISRLDGPVKSAGRAKYPSEVARLLKLGVQVIHDERESAVAMVRAAVSSYERPDIEPEQVVREVLDHNG